MGTMQPFFGVFLMQSHGMSVADTGMVLALFGAGTLVSPPVAGWASDRFGRRATLTGGMLATTVTMLALAYAPNVPAIVCGMFVLGVVIEAYRPASQALLADIVSPEDRPRAFGLLFWGINLGFSIAMISGGLIAESAGYRPLFWINATTCVIFGALVWRAIPEARPVARDRLPGGFRDVLADRVMIAYLGVTLLYAFAYGQGYTSLPIAMNRIGLPDTAYGTAIALNGILILVVQPLVNDRLARRDLSNMLAVGYAVVGIGMALTAAATSLPGFAATIVIWTLGEIFTAGMGGAVVASLAPAHLRGRYNGLYILAWSLSNVIAPLAGTRLLEIDRLALWLTAGACGLAAAGGQILLAPAIRRRSLASQVLIPR